MRLTAGQAGITLAAALGLVLALANMVLFEKNRTLQAEVSTRAQYIQQSVQLEGLQREIVNAIASLALRNKDDALKTILSQQGITFKAEPSESTSSPAAPDTKGRR